MGQQKDRLNKAASSDIMKGFLYALFNFYVSGYYLDLKREKYYAIGQMAEYNERYGSENDWSGMDKYIRECVHEEDQQLLTEVSRIDYIRERLRKEQSYSVEIRDHGTGQERWYRYTTMRGADADHAAVSFMDVTDQVLARKELERLTQASQVELALNQTLGIYSWRITIDEKNNMRYVQWAENSCRSMGIQAKPGQPASMRTMYNLIHPDLLPAFIMELQKTVQDESGKYILDFDNKQETENGTEKWFHCTGRMVAFSEGKGRAIIGAFRDITDSYLVGEERRELAEVRDLMQAARWTVRFNYDGTAKEVEFSDEVRRALGYENEEDFPNSLEFWTSIMHPDDVDVRESAMMAAVLDQTGRTQYDIRYRLKKKDGEYLWVRSAIRIHRDEVGLAESAVGVFVDVNDSVLRTEAEKKLREINDEQTAQLEEITALNAQLEENQTKLEESTAEQEAQIEEIAALNRQLEGNQAELESSLAEQEEQIEEISALNTELEEAGRKAEEGQKKISEAYGMIEGFSHEYHTIWVVNKETLEMRLIRSTGVSTVKSAVQLGKDYPDFDTAFEKYIETSVEPEDRGRMHMEIASSEVLRHLKKNPNEIYAVNYLRRDESDHVGYHQIAFANADAGDVKQFVYGFRDIDKIVKEEQAQRAELKEAKEAAEAANAAKTSFLFNMSHDIRTPMNAIMGFRDLLEKHQDDPEKRRDYLNKIQDASTVLLSIINNVLEMSRIEKGTLEIDETAWSTVQFNDTLYSVFHEMMNEKGLTFTRQIDVQHPYVYCDPIKLREIFINILSNAYKYTNAGGQVNMHLEEIPSDREGWVLYRTTISDTGIGMSEEFLPHIFEEFSRENNTTDAKVEGTGLGMPIVKRLVEMLDGTIEIKSRKGEGSTFIVTIPHRIADRSKLVDHAGVQIDPELFKGKHILLAEDNDLNAEIATEILIEAGFIVERAEDGAICVDMLEKSETGYYDMILMDIQMPNMNGYEATRVIRQMEDHEKSDIKILAMTANAFEEDRREALKAGMNGHLAKPINVNELMKTLASMIG